MRPVVVTYRAAREISDAAEWWRANRQAAARLIQFELERARSGCSLLGLRSARTRQMQGSQGFGACNCRAFDIVSTTGCVEM